MIRKWSHFDLRKGIDFNFLNYSVFNFLLFGVQSEQNILIVVYLSDFGTSLSKADEVVAAKVVDWFSSGRVLRRMKHHTL